MTIDHVAIWTTRLEELKDYYVKYFHGSSNDKYTNQVTNFESYFITFSSGSKIELMQKPGILNNHLDLLENQHLGLTHLSFSVENMNLVVEKAKELKKDGFKILSGPRITGDGYYEFETMDPDNNRIEVSAVFVE
jgi:lactoylglutathione lyase